MESVRHRAFLPLPALIPLSSAFFLLTPAFIYGGDPLPVLLAAASPTDRLSPPVNWIDDLELRLKTYFAKKYPAYDFIPYAEELERIRSATNRGDRWGAKREMGRFLSMLVSRAHGLGDDAAEELALLSQHIMPDEEFGIVYPGSRTEP